ncbi:hypothetical protein J9317_16650 [Metabacillus sp. KIGAM252]|uniref:Uncharacterized protein n=1 Tax=Metabacillus flavus TaxID=2823519 RepID=A0ABS5LI29_9BACI|nr:hypothetical protein [Metabacillus flavus]MBS2970378.1 hypothetical protein [Metabacillus flavus]
MDSETISFSLEEAVNSCYSNEALKKHFYQKKESSVKRNGNLGANQTKQLIENMKVDWGNVEISGDGFERIITCTGKKSTPSVRQDNRKNNGKKQIPYEDIVRRLVVSYLQEEAPRPATTTFKKFAFDIGLMSETLYEASKKILANQQIAHYNNLKPKYRIGYSMFWHIIPRESKRITDHLKSVLQRMNDDGILFYREVTNAVILQDGKEEHNPIDVVEANKIRTEIKKLYDKHSVTYQDTLYRPKHAFVLAFKKDEQKYFEAIGIQYIYTAMIVEHIDTSKEIVTVSGLLEDYKNAFAENAERLAIKIQYDFFHKLLSPKNNNKLIEIFGGKQKPLHAIFIGTEYEKVMNEINRLAYDAIAQAKVSGTYPKEYRENLEIILDVK